MSRPQSRWWRAYDAALENPKVQRLSDRLFRTWFNVLCIACRHGGALPPTDDVAFLLRIKSDDARKRLDDLKEAGLIDDIDGRLQPHDWDQMQFQSDVSTGRVKRFRQSQRNVSPTLHETAPETETETETETDRSLLRKDSSTAEPIDLLAERKSKEKREAKRLEEAIIREIGEGWNELADACGLSAINTIKEGRERRVRSRMAEVQDHGFDDPAAAFREIFARVRGSPFLRGQNDRNWRVTFDWLVQPANFAKILEGAYAVREKPKSYA